MVMHQRRIAMMELGRDPVMDKITDKHINLRQRQVRTTDNSVTIVAVLSTRMLWMRGFLTRASG